MTGCITNSQDYAIKAKAIIKGNEDYKKLKTVEDKADFIVKNLGVLPNSELKTFKILGQPILTQAIKAKIIILNNSRDPQKTEQEFEDKIAQIEDRTPDSVVLNKRNVKDWFINNSVIYTQIETEFKRDAIIQTFYFNKDFTTVAADIQNAQWASVYSYLSKVDPDFAATLNRQLYVKNGTGTYTYTENLTYENIQKIKKIITQNYQLKQDQLYDLNHTNQEQYRALKALAILWGFDHFVKQTFGNSIEITDNLGRFTTVDKYKIKVINKQTDSWRTNEDIAYSDDWSGLFKSLITTIPIYDSNNREIENRYLTIAEFNGIISSIRQIRKKKDFDFLTKNIVGNYIAQQNLPQELHKYIEYFKQENITTLHKLIAHIRLNPEMDIKILFEFLNSKDSLGKPYYKKYVPYDNRQSFISLDKALFTGMTPYSKASHEIPIYFFIAKVMASTSVLEYTQEYYEENSSLVGSNLFTSIMFDKTKKMLQTMVDNRYALKEPFNYQQLTESKYKITQQQVDKTTYTIVQLNKGNQVITIKLVPSEGSTNKIKELSITQNGITGKVSALSNDVIKEIFTDWTGYQVDEKFFEAFTNESDISELLNFAAIIMASAHQKYESGKTIEQYFGTEQSRILNTATGEKSIIPNIYAPLLGSISQAYDISKNNTNKSAINDSKGNSIGTFSPSRLFEGMDYINNFVINEGVLSQMKIRKILDNITPFREFKGQKNSIEFSPNEVFHNSFVVNFLGKIGIDKPTQFSIHPYVIADKSIVLYGDIDFVKFRGLFGTAEDGTPFIKSVKDLFKEESIQKMHGMIKEDLGGVYKNLFDNVVNTWSEVSKRIQLASKPGIDMEGFAIDPKNDFELFNSWLKKNNLTLYDFNSLYAKELRGITLFEELYYVIDGNGNLRFNRTLLSLYCRFNDITPDLVSPKFESLNIPSYGEFVDYQEKALIRDLFVYNTKLKLPKELIGESKIVDPSWTIGEYMIYAKSKQPEVDSKGNPVKRDGKPSYVDVPIYTLEDFQSAMNKGTLIINPYLKAYNWIHYLTSQEIALATSGTYLLNPAKASINNYDGEWDAYEEESERYTTATKRKVGMSANIDLFIPCRKGLPRKIKIATIQEETTPMFNYVGDKGKAKVQDGMTYVDGISTELERASLGSQASKGYVTKPLEVGFDSNTGSQVLIKTASQALTGYNQRRSYSNRMVTANLQDSYDIDSSIDLTKSEEGNPINYRCYYRDFTYDKDGRATEVYYMVSNLKKVGDYQYTYSLTPVDIEGNPIGDTQNDLPRHISTIYDLYLLLGGENSVSFEGDTLSYRNNNDQAANKTIAYVMGEIPKLKDSLIHQAPTSGAIKCGGANINPKKVLHGRHVLATQDLDLGRSGTQLDKTHEAEGAHISILTQVMNALSARGYTQQKAREVYEVVHNICVNAASEFIEISDEIYKEKYVAKTQTSIKQIEKFKQLFADTIIDRLVSGSTDYVALLAQWFTDLNDKGLVTFKDRSLPLSMNSVYNQCIQTIASSVSKLGIKLKFNGLLAVLCPSHGIYRLFGKKTLDQFHGLTEMKREYDSLITSIKDNPKALNDALESGEIIPAHKIALGTSYIVFDENGNQLFTEETDEFGNTLLGEDGQPLAKPTIVNVSSPAARREIRQKYKGKKYYFKEVWYTTQKNATIKKGEYFIDNNGNVQRFTAQDSVGGVRQETMVGTKFIPQGRDLEPYDVYFTGSFTVKNGEKEQTFYNQYSLWDLDIIKEMEAAQGNRYKTVVVRRRFQKIVNALEHKQPITVQINGQNIVVNTDSIEVKPYENICPNINLPEFGIEPGTNLSEINEDFFYNVVSEKRRLTADENNYDYAIRSINGDHLYIINDNDQNAEAKINGLTQVDESRIGFVTKGSISETWLLDNDGNRMFKLTDNGNQESNDIVYTDVKGNIIIRTTNINTLINYNSNKGDTIYISDEYDLNNFKIPYNGKNLPLKKFVREIEKDSQKASILIRQLFIGETSIRDLIQDLPISNKEALIKDFETKQNITSQLSNSFNIEVGKDPELLDIQIRKEARQMYSSFLTTLENVASRTPSQSMQSFMAMKTVAFDNTGVNNVYVSPYQLWLQGSDFDIDAASMLGYAISKNGKFVDWSPFFTFNSKKQLNASFGLPFPTGNEQLVTKDPTFKYDNIEQLYNSIVNPNKSVKDIETIADFIRQVNKRGFPILEESTDKETAKKQRRMADVIMNKVNAHNTYFIDDKGRVMTDRMLTAGNNFIARGIYEIIKSPANVIQAQAPIDTYADVAKEIGRGIRDLDLPIFKKTQDINEEVKGVSIIKVNKAWKNEPDKVNNTYRIYLTKKLPSLDKFKSEVVMSEEDILYQPSDISELQGIPYFELVQDLEEGNYSVHFKAKRGELSEQEKAILFKALAKLIPVGSRVSTFGTLTKGGISGVIRLGALIGDTVVGVRQVKERFEPNESKYANLPGNAFNFGQEQATNSTGKKCIEITAAAMKALESVINATNQTILDMKTINDNNLNYIKSQFSLLGRKYQMIANAYGRSAAEGAQQIIEQARNDIDSLLELSVLLTLSTDNAKELILSKIIALEETMSLYVAGVAYGLSIGELSRVMVSKSMKSLIKIMKPNFFDRYDGYNRFSRIIDYVDGKLGFTLNQCKSLNKIEGLSDKIADCFTNADGEKPTISFVAYQQDEFNEESDGIAVANEFLSKIEFTGNIEKDINSLNKLKNVIKNALNHPNANQCADVLWRILDWANIKATIISDTVTVFNPTNITPEGVKGSDCIKKLSVWEELKKLSIIGDQFTELASLDSINKEIKTKPEELLSYLVRFEDMLINQGRRVKSKDNLPSVDLSKFLRDEEYKESIINTYDQYLKVGEEKIGINIPYIISQNIQYMGYLRDMEALLTGDRESITRFRVTENLFRDIKSSIPYDSIDKAVKNIGVVVNSFVINSWLRRQQPVVVPKGARVYCDKTVGGSSMVTAVADTPIQLGTTSGNQSFTYFMERVLIPKLKSGDTKDLLGVTDVALKDNLFIKNLASVADPNTVSGNARYENSLYIELNRLNTPNDSDQFVRHKRALQQLKAYKYQGYSLYELFYLYSLVVFNDTASKYNFSPLFNDDVTNRSSELINDYINYWKSFDNSPDIKEYIDKMQVLSEIAPKGKRNDSKITKYFSGSSWVTNNGHSTGVNPKIFQPKLFNASKVWLSPSIQFTIESDDGLLKIGKLIYKGEKVKLDNPLDLIFAKTVTTKAYKYDKEAQEFTSESYESTVQYGLDEQLTMEAIERYFNNPCK